MPSKSKTSKLSTTFNKHGLHLRWPRVWIIILGLILLFLAFSIAGMEAGHTIYDFRRSTAFGGFILFIPLLICAIFVMITGTMKSCFYSCDRKFEREALVCCDLFWPKFDREINREDLNIQRFLCIRCANNNSNPIIREISIHKIIQNTFKLERKISYEIVEYTWK